MKKYLLMLLCLTICTISYSQNFNLTFKDSIHYGVDASNLWGYVSPTGSEYALVGVADGLSIVDVTNPTNITELYRLPAANSIWREVRVWRNYAYCVTEGGGGMLIADLSSLPGTQPTYVYWNGGSNYNYDTGHTVYVDTLQKMCYIFGAKKLPNTSVAAIILDISTNPMNPTVLGEYTGNYIHDGIVRNDTLYGAHVYDGYFSAIDVSNKANPTLMLTHNTPSNFTHNLSLNNAGNVLWSTDEKSNAYVAAYDISDFSNITELGRFQATPGSLSIPHNTYTVNSNYQVCSWYRDGICIIDATHPNAMVLVGRYDTSPLNGDGFNGDWGVFPYFPSGNLVISDIESGLFVFTPTYLQACYIDGTITDSICGGPVTDFTISINGTVVNSQGDLLGNYTSGYYQSGLQTIVYSKPGYVSKSITVNLTTGSFTTIPVQLVPVAGSFTLNGMVDDASTQTGIVNANVVFDNGTASKSYYSDNSGNYTDCPFLPGNYTYYAGNWGYLTQSIQQNLSSTSAPTPIHLTRGYYDDFSVDEGWTVSSTATSGIWERGTPVGTNLNGNPSNPAADLAGDFWNKCYVTGNGGGNASNDDVDNGTTKLTSPAFDLSGSQNVNISYYTWFFNGGGAGNPNDTLKVELTNGSTSVTVQTTTKNDTMSAWTFHSFNPAGLIPLTNNMHISFTTGDKSSSGHIVEAGLDKFRIGGDLNYAYVKPTNTELHLSPNPCEREMLIEQISNIKSIELFNIFGQTLHPSSVVINLSKAKIDVSNLPSALYMAKVTSVDGTCLITKFVKQ